MIDETQTHPGEPVEIPLVVTSQDAPPAPTPPEPASPGRGDTSYVILQESATETDGWVVALESCQARSADAAIRAYTDGMKADQLDADGVTLIAIPARSWKLVRIKPQVVTTLVFEDGSPAVDEDAS